MTAVNRIAAPPRLDRLRRTAVRSIAWSAIETWGSHAVSFAVFLTLARLLDAEAFGLLSLAMVAIAFLQVFVDQGFGEAIIQRETLEPEHLDTSFWTALVVGLALAAGTAASASAIASLLNDVRLEAVIRWLAPGFVLTALSTTHRAILRRSFAFRSLAARTLVAIVAGGGAGVGAALLGYGVESLVAQALVQWAVAAGVLWWLSDWRPRLRFSWRHFRDLFVFGISVTGSQVLNLVNRRSDDLLIGVFLGPFALGYYTVANRSVGALAEAFISVTSRVAVPTFSRLQSNRDRMRRALYGAIRYTSIVAFPGFIGLAALAPEFVEVLFGRQWMSAVPVMQVLAFIGIVQSIEMFHGNALLACGKPAWRLGISAVNAISNVIAFSIAVRWGIVAVALAYVVRGYVMLPLSFILVRRVLGIRLRDHARQWRLPLIGASIMAIAVLSAAEVEGGSVPVRLIVLLAVATATYGVFLAVFHRNAVREALTVLHGDRSGSVCVNGFHEGDSRHRIER